MKTYRYAIYGYTHPIDFPELIGRYRWRWSALLALLYWRQVGGGFGGGHAWVREEVCICTEIR